MNDVPFSAQTACIWEVTARKAGNVHISANFHDMHYVDFLLSAAALADCLQRENVKPLGELILQCVRASRQVTRTNTNLGIILLLVPLAKVDHSDFSSGILKVLESTTIDDSKAVFEAIRLANPAGLGETDEQSVHDTPSIPLRDVMSLASSWDTIARQYANGFQEVLQFGVPLLQQALRHNVSLENAIIETQLEILSEIPDTHIARKYGQPNAENVRQQAKKILLSWKEIREIDNRFLEFDHWLRSARQNPGTTADLVCASLFVALRNGIIQLPLDLPWSSGKHHEAAIPNSRH